MNPEKIIVIKSKSTNPYYNLAYEEYLLNELSKEDLVILFYKNHNTIVIGRNQNPWHETAYSKFINQGGKLVRRFSGGGTVFHDSGNLNFSFLSSKTNYNLDWNFKIIQKTLREFKIKSQLTDRYDLFINQYKFSGNAFHLKRNKACHHGTLLLNSDLKNISKYLKPEISITEGNYIPSKSSPVTNLSKYNNDLTINNFVERFIKILNLSTNINKVIEKDVDPESLTINKELYFKNKSWDWIYGRTPDFSTVIGNEYITIKLKVNRGIIKYIAINNLELDLFDLCETKVVLYLKGFLLGEEFNPEKIYLVLNSLFSDHNDRIINKHLY